MFVHTLTTDYKYSRRNMLKFTQELEGPFSQKQKSFYQFFIAFLKCALSLENLQKIGECPSRVFSRIIDS